MIRNTNTYSILTRRFAVFIVNFEHMKCNDLAFSIQILNLYLPTVGALILLLLSFVSLLLLSLLLMFSCIITIIIIKSFEVYHEETSVPRLSLARSLTKLVLNESLAELNRFAFRQQKYATICY